MLSDKHYAQFSLILLVFFNLLSNRTHRAVNTPFLQLFSWRMMSHQHFIKYSKCYNQLLCIIFLTCFLYKQNLVSETIEPQLWGCIYMSSVYMIAISSFIHLYFHKIYHIFYSYIRCLLASIFYLSFIYHKHIYNHIYHMSIIIYQYLPIMSESSVSIIIYVSSINISHLFVIFTYLFIMKLLLYVVLSMYSLNLQKYSIFYSLKE